MTAFILQPVAIRLGMSSGDFVFYAESGQYTAAIGKIAIARDSDPNALIRLIGAFPRDSMVWLHRLDASGKPAISRRLLGDLLASDLTAYLGANL